MSGRSQHQGRGHPRGYVHGIAGSTTAMPGTTCAISIAAAILIGAATPAFTHAHLVRSSPPIDASVQTAPREVAIFFSERVQEAGSSIMVENSEGVRVDEGNVSVDLNGRLLRAALKPIAEGRYKVKWRVRSADTHTSEGVFSFEVRK